MSTVNTAELRHALLEEFKNSPGQATASAQALFDDAARLNALRPGARVILTPPVLSPEEQATMFKACRDVLNIILTLHERIFDGDLRRMGSWCGYTEEMLDLLLMDAQAVEPEILARGDMYETAGGWKLLEMNVGSNVGGMTFSALTRLMLRQEFFKEVFARRGIAPVDSLTLWADFTGKLVAGERDARVRLALVESRESLAGMAHTLGMMARELAREDEIDAFVCAADELTGKDGGLFYGDARVDVVYRLFDLGDFANGTGDYQSIFRALARREVSMPMGLHYKMFGNKCALALLSDPAFAEHFSEEERETIARHVPWTRVLSGETFETAIDRRAGLVVKPAEGYGGIDVVCGCDTSDEEWRALLSSLLVSGEKYVLQERLVPTTAELCLASQGEALSFKTCQLLWGAYAFGGEFAGAILRAKPTSEDKVINYRSGAFICPVLFSRTTSGE